jgi:hypothetical protein
VEISPIAVRQTVERLGARGKTFLFDEVREELKIAPEDKTNAGRAHNIIARWLREGALDIPFPGPKRNRLYRIKDPAKLQSSLGRKRRRVASPERDQRVSGRSEQLEQVQKSLSLLHETQTSNFKNIQEKLERLESLILLRTASGGHS